MLSEGSGLVTSAETGVSEMYVNEACRRQTKMNCAVLSHK